MNLQRQTIEQLARLLASGATTSRALVEAALETVADDGRAFTHVDFAGARAAADASDAARTNGQVPSPFAGVPISVKDLFDVAGQTTAAGSLILRGAPPAVHDAPVVARLRKAGAVIVGRTQMSEFAFTGLGLNPHWPVLPNPHDEQRAPGGSSSGAAVAVARGQCAMGLGTDTGGSTRIPAAFCGVTGFKPTQRRITRDGAFPLSVSLDSIGPIANSVACCRITDAAIADEPAPKHAAVALGALRLAVPLDFVLDDMEPAVASAFERTLARLSANGAKIERVRMPAFARVPELSARGILANAQAYSYHSLARLLQHRAQYDPNVLSRIEGRGKESAAHIIDIVEARKGLIAETNAATRGVDALLYPTVPIVAPRLAEIAEAAAFAKVNMLALRNTALVNLLDRCALSLPMQDAGALPCGLMIVGETMADARLFAIGEAVEAALR